MPHVIGISGPTRAGKTTLARNVAALYGSALNPDHYRPEQYDHANGETLVEYAKCASCHYCITGITTTHCCKSCRDLPGTHGPYCMRTWHTQQRVIILHQDRFFHRAEYDDEVWCGPRWLEMGEAYNDGTMQRRAMHIMENSLCDLLILEGFRLFWNPEFIDMMQDCFWLDVEQSEVYDRRMRTTRVSDEYFQECIWPEHQRYCEHVAGLQQQHLSFASKFMKLDGLMPTQLNAARVLTRAVFRDRSMP